MGSQCPFFQQTGDGKRCVLLSPEDWRVRKSRLEQYCFNGGRGCPVVFMMYRANGGKVFLNDLRKKENMLK